MPSTQQLLKITEGKITVKESEWDEKSRCTRRLGWLSWQKRQTKEGGKLNLILQLVLWLHLCISLLLNQNRPNSGSLGFKPFSLWLVVKEKKREWLLEKKIYILTLNLPFCHPRRSDLMRTERNITVEVKNLPFEQWWNIRKMLLGKSLTSQALRPKETPDLLKTEEAHQWKLWEEERRGKPSTRLEYNRVLCDSEKPWYFTLVC